jgi:hypothetical protein
MIKTRINNEYKDIIKIFGGGTLQKEIIKVWSREAQEYVYESPVEYTGTLPITINANDDALLDYRIYGVDGGVGEPTENLFDESTVESGGYINPDSGDFVSNSNWTLSDYIKVSGYYINLSAKLIYVFGGWAMIHNFYDSNKSWLGGENTTQGVGTLGERKSKSYSISGVAYVRVSYRPAVFDDIMLVKGSTAPTSYIPYGYKLPMTVSDGNTAQTVPVYIGENQLDSVEGVADYVDKANGKIVRMIGEYTFTGDESFNKYGNSDVFYTSTTIDPVGITTVNTITMRCNHPAFTAIENKDTRYWLNPEADDICCFLPGGRSQVFLRSTSNFATAAECKAYLKAQYDNGTPVKISYWLKTPIEEDPPVPLPEIPTIDGTTIIDYDGDPKPSQMYIKYRR